VKRSQTSLSCDSSSRGPSIFLHQQQQARKVKKSRTHLSCDQQQHLAVYLWQQHSSAA
jgi:hypothetical protein